MLWHLLTTSQLKLYRRASLWVFFNCCLWLFGSLAETPTQLDMTSLTSDVSRDSLGVALETRPMAVRHSQPSDSLKVIAVFPEMYVSVHQRNWTGLGETMTMTMTMTHILSNSLPLTVTCPFPGVLCESHWHLDGRVSPVCVCRPAGVRRSQLCLQATQGVHQTEKKAAAAEDSKCWPSWHRVSYTGAHWNTQRKDRVRLQNAS